MVAPNDDRRLHLALTHQPVEQLPRLLTLPITQPANAGRQSLKLNALFGHVQPARQPLVLRKQFQQSSVRQAEVFRVTRKSDPTKRAAPLAKLRTDVSRHKTR